VIVTVYFNPRHRLDVFFRPRGDGQIYEYRDSARAPTPSRLLPA